MSDEERFNGPLAEILRPQNAASNRGGERYAPLALTRLGANMLSAVLKTPVAVVRRQGCRPGAGLRLDRNPAH